MGEPVANAMPAPVSPLANALRLLKVELIQARNAGAEPKAASGAHSRAAPINPGAAAPSALQALPAKLRALRAQKGGDLPRSKTLRLFVEAALLEELGSELQLDPAFGDLVERTCGAIEQDAGSASLLTDALTELQALAN